MKTRHALSALILTFLLGAPAMHVLSGIPHPVTPVSAPDTLMPVTAPDALTLEQCLEAAVQHAPRSGNRALLEQQNALVEKNIRANWYPSLELNGKASYQSDVVTIEFENASIPIAVPEMPRDQYSLNLDVRQTIYDGGMSKSRSAYEQSHTAAELQAIEVNLQSVREQVTGLYFSVLLAQENRNSLEIMLTNLKAREAALVSALENGAAMEKDLKVIRVEILKLLQSLSEIDAARNGALGMMEVLTGLPVSPDTRLAAPYLQIDEDAVYSRPEFQLFQLQEASIEAGKALAAAARFPKVFAFGQAGYGRPGYNMLSTEFDTYYMVGVGLQWNIWDWNSTTREKQILDAKRQMIGNARETLIQSLDARSRKEIEAMEHLKGTIELDDKILEMQMEITRDAASQLENGVITATDYLLELNDESAARINRSRHRVQLLQSMANYKLIQGTL